MNYYCKLNCEYPRNEYLLFVLVCYICRNPFPIHGSGCLGFHAQHIARALPRQLNFVSNLRLIDTEVWITVTAWVGLPQNVDEFWIEIVNVYAIYVKNSMVKSFQLSYCPMRIISFLMKKSEDLSYLRNVVNHENPCIIFKLYPLDWENKLKEWRGLGGKRLKVGITIIPTSLISPKAIVIRWLSTDGRDFFLLESEDELHWNLSVSSSAINVE